MLQELLEKRQLLPILTHDDGTPVTVDTWGLRRAEMQSALERYSYGHTPAAPDKVWAEKTDENPTAYAGKARDLSLNIFFETGRGVFSFPVRLLIPTFLEKPPVFMQLAFRRDVPDRYLPAEEIIDAGYAIAVVCYKDIVNDELYGDYSDGLAQYFGTTIDRQPEEWGKIGMWAYGVSRFMDYLVTRDDLDTAHVALSGHSRLGKTALWAGAQDPRFWAVISNCSGYGGAASSKHGTGERVTDFLRAGSWDWYCENFKDYAGEKEDAKPYDQAYLLALVAPRLLCVGSAVEDIAADPESEFLTSLWASQAWDLLGKPGLITPDKLPTPGDSLNDGGIHYHLRKGLHYHSREDWNHYIRFLNQKLAEETK